MKKDKEVKPLKKAVVEQAKDRMKKGKEMTPVQKKVVKKPKK